MATLDGHACGEGGGCCYHDLSEWAHLHDVLELLVHVSERELACRSEVSGQRMVLQGGEHVVTSLTVLQFVDQLLIVVQLEFVDAVDQALNVSHPCSRKGELAYQDL